MEAKNQENAVSEQKKVSPIPLAVVIIIMIIGFTSCMITSDMEKTRNQKFKAMAENTLKDYDKTIERYSISAGLVVIVVKDNIWNNSFIEETAKRLQVNANDSGFLKKSDVQVVYKKTDGTEIKKLTIKRN